MKNVKLDNGKHIEVSMRKGGYRTIISANRAAVTHGYCFVRDDSRNIVGQTINKELPLWIK